MGKYNRHARREMRRKLGAGAGVSNEAIEKAIDVHHEMMAADKLIPTMKGLISHDLQQKYERQVNKEILPRIIERYLLSTMYILHEWPKTRLGPQRMKEFFVELFQLQIDMKNPELHLTMKEMREYLESVGMNYEGLVKEANKIVEREQEEYNAATKGSGSGKKKKSA